MGKLLLLTLNEQEETAIDKIISAISNYMRLELVACGDGHCKGYVKIRAKLLTSGNVHGNDFPTEKRPFHCNQ